MSLRGGQGWQTSLADLSLILFLVAAAAASQQAAKPSVKPPARASSSQSSPAPSPQTEPLSVYVAAPGAPPLAQWLREQAADPRQQLTITARYGPGEGAQSRALTEAGQLLAEAGAQGRSARIVVEPGMGAVRAALAYDSPYEGAPGDPSGK